MPMNPEWEEQVAKAVADVMSVENHFIGLYLFATGLKIQDVELVRKTDRMTGETLFYCRPRNRD
jgi:hypothetical protein